MECYRVLIPETKSHLAGSPEAVVRWETETGEFPEVHSPAGLLYKGVNKTRL